MFYFNHTQTQSSCEHIQSILTEVKLDNNLTFILYVANLIIHLQYKKYKQIDLWIKKL